MKSNKQLIDEYFANGGTVTVIPFIEDKYEPAKNLIPSHRPHCYDQYGKRIYDNLNKMSYSIEQDPTTLNYGE